MALLNYLRPVNFFHDPKCMLSASIFTQAITQAEREVENTIHNKISVQYFCINFLAHSIKNQKE